MSLILNLLTSRIYNGEGQLVNAALLYYKGTTDMASRAYLPYLAVEYHQHTPSFFQFCQSLLKQAC